MKVSYEPRARLEYIEWAKKDMKMFDRVNKLIEDIVRHPFEGIGKPEPLKHNKSDIGQEELTTNIGLYIVLWTMIH